VRHAAQINPNGPADILAIMTEPAGPSWPETNPTARPSWPETNPTAGLGHVRDQVGDALTGFLRRQRAQAGQIAAELSAPIDAICAVLDGGKRLRPAFCYWGWRGAGGADQPEIFTAAAALELLHASALVHDDVLDDSDTRRGRPSVHRLFAARHAEAGWRGDADEFGRGTAILLGDLLLAWTDELLQASGLPEDALSRGRPVLDLMRTEMLAGQYLDLLEQATAAGTVQGALRVVRYKTARYTIERPLHLGAALAGPANPSLTSGYSRYGLPLGVAFQLRDDVLGVFGDPARTGKPAGDDVREGKRTVLAAIAREKATAAQAQALDRLLGNPAIGEAGVAEFRDLLTGTGALADCEAMIGGQVAEALAAVPSLPAPAEVKSALAALAITATDRRG
jgi:geranylgeranyl diphosphate synthase, type I